MRLYREEILALIAAQPGLRTVQIADKIGCEIDAVEASIEADLYSGAVMKREVIAPNKRKASAFWMGEGAAEGASTARPRTRAEIATDFILAQPNRIATSADLHRELRLAGHELPSAVLADALADGRLFKEGKFWAVPGEEPPATVEGSDTTDSLADATLAPEVPATASELPPELVSQLSRKAQAELQNHVPAAREPDPAPTASEPPTKAQLAMDFIRSRPNQMATAVELRAVMGLRSNQYPDPWLTNFREKGEVHKDGNYWKLGPRRAITEQDRNHVREVLNGEFRCALWNDGELQLVRGEATITKLSRRETEALRMFLENARAVA